MSLALLCEHSYERLVEAGHRLVCPTCHSFWDRRALAADVEYNDEYPDARGHFDPQVGQLKVRTLQGWLERSGVDPDGRTVCETGYGSGVCLAYLRSRGAQVFGVEVIEANRRHAMSLGVPSEVLLHAATLPPRLPVAVDLWLFQDAFEHIPQPTAFAEWMMANSSDDCEILIVLPEAHSPSERLLSRWWPHRVPDHQFHWSARGISEFWSRRGFRLVRRFTPVKWISPSMLLAHGRILRRHRVDRAVSGRFAFPFNIGEFGALFRRQRA